MHLQYAGFRKGIIFVHMYIRATRGKQFLQIQPDKTLYAKPNQPITYVEAAKRIDGPLISNSIYWLLKNGTPKLP